MISLSPLHFRAPHWKAKNDVPQLPFPISSLQAAQTLPGG
jgi:hypothetical protein